MSDDPGTVHGATEGGVSGKHPDPPPFAFLAAPSTSSESNTARLRLIPVACWRVDDIRFAFDSSFITSTPDDELGDIRAELKELNTLVQAHPGCPLSVFGHADPVGSDDYNKALSGRRTMAVYALLIIHSDPAKAVQLWTKICTTENWHSDERDTMRALTNLPTATSDDALFKAYLEALCPDDLKLDPHQDFLARGADSGGKGDYQGCGEFNPMLIFSQEKQQKFDDAKSQNDTDILDDRNSQNAISRRVMVLLFRKGSEVDPAKWPCPRATEGIDGCVKRFFSDGQTRRSNRLPEDDRRFNITHDTFACRFYQRISDNSVCDALERSQFRIAIILRSNSGALALQNDPVTVTLNTGLQLKGKTDDSGLYVAENIPPGDHILQIEGVEIVVPAMNKGLPPRMTRVPGLRRIK